MAVAAAQSETILKNLPHPITRQRLQLVWILAVAGALSAVSAMMGINPDAAQFYTAGLRHIAGQRLYDEFYLPFGPVTGLVYALVLAASPTGGLAFVALSAALQIAATFCVWRLVYHATASCFHALVGGLFTAFWYTVQFGGFYNDHLAYLFVLVAAVALVAGIQTERKALLIGTLLCLSFYTKQTTGILASLSFLAASLLGYGAALLKTRLFWYTSVAYIGAHLAMLIMIAMFADLSGFIYYFVQIPFNILEYARPENKDPVRLLMIWLTPYFLNPVAALRDMRMGELSFYPLVLVIYMSYASAVMKWNLLSDDSDRMFSFGFFLISTMLCSALIGRLYTHLTWGLGGVLAMVLWLWRDRIIKGFSLLLLGTFLGIGLLQAAVERSVFSPGVVERRYDLWPVEIKNNDWGIDGDALSDLIEFMRYKNGDYAVLDEEPYLLPLVLGRAPINPPVFYIYGQTIPVKVEGRTQWEREYIAALAEAEYVVSGLGSGLTFRTPSRAAGTHQLPRPEIPLVVRYLAKEFTPVLRRAGLVVYQRNSAQSTTQREGALQRALTRISQVS
jgi:hypothetical protein